MDGAVAEGIVTPPPWPDTESEYELKEIIGFGSMARVYGSYCIPRNEKCAIKVVDITKYRINTEDLLRQFQMMSTYKHPNLVTYCTSFVVQNNLWLVLSLLEGGSLRDIINYKMAMTNCKHGVFDEMTIATVLKDVLRGLEYLNGKGQAHRDIKAANILIGDNGVIQLTDFGITAWLSSGVDLIKKNGRGDFKGSAHWIAPEVLDVELYPNVAESDTNSVFKADIWSVGITAIELATGNTPYYKYPPMKVIKLTLLEESPNLDTGASQKDQYRTYGKTFRKFIAVCLHKNPGGRPTAAELLEHPFFKKARDRKLLTQTVVPVGPSYVTRVQKASKVKGEKSDTLYRTESKEWILKQSVEGESSTAAGKQQEVENDSQTDEKKSKFAGLKKMWSDMMRKFKRLGSSSPQPEEENEQSMQKVDELTTKETAEQEKAEKKIAEKTKSVQLNAEKKRAERYAEEVGADEKTVEYTWKKLQIETMEPIKIQASCQTEVLTESGPWSAQQRREVVPPQSLGLKPSTSQDPGPSTSNMQGSPGFSIKLRFRSQGKLRAINFLYSPDKEAPEVVAAELVKAGLLDPLDAVPIANYLSQLLKLDAAKCSTTPIVFHLNSTGPNEEYDERKLMGFAQMTLQ